MTWDFQTNTEPIAKKDYRCEASQILFDLSDRDIEPEDLVRYLFIKHEKGVIKKGSCYLKTKGMWEGEFVVFRARMDADELCRKYELYSD